MKFKKVLVLAPHTDDGEIGAGGFIAKLIEEGSDVYYAAFSIAEQSVPEGFPKDILKTEVKNATAKLGLKESNLFVYNYEVRKLNYARQEILEDLVALGRKIDFDLILMPSVNDLHQDHATVAQEGLRAFKRKSICCYELIWNNLSFNFQCFVSITEEQLQKKMAALREYKSQGFREYINDEFVRALAITRGVQSGNKYAEVFEVVRLMIK
ncbi:MAG TPA: PIG-L deacetylase family protein [Flavipsychrobacter sp.]|nr:PIG-L deacetylase family protein [Flavipsychrobacter sp.]